MSWDSEPAEDSYEAYEAAGEAAAWQEGYAQALADLRKLARGTILHLARPDLADVLNTAADGLEKRLGSTPKNEVDQ